MLSCLPDTKNIRFVSTVGKQGLVVLRRSSPNATETSMKRTNPGHGEVPNLPLSYQLTIIDTSSLPQRIADELTFLLDRLGRAWIICKRDPIGFSRSLLANWRTELKPLLLPDSLAGVVVALLVVSLALVAVLLGKGRTSVVDAVASDDGITEITTLALTQASAPVVGTGVGAGDRGQIGLASGTGEGSRPEPKQSRGGGGGGDHTQQQPGHGSVPQPSEIPAPIPTLPAARERTLAVAGVQIDPALWKQLPEKAYGDPRSASTIPENGPGDGGGVGTGNGTGVGEGKGPGFGPGEGGNIGGDANDPGDGGPAGGPGNYLNPNRVFPLNQVTQRARVLLKPEPQYTEEARRNQITGTVVLRVIFSRTGEVTNIRAIQSLPLGLTERAIAAARQIRFTPALREGQPVSVFMQLEYNFNIY
jgi:TonB family protein